MAILLLVGGYRYRLRSVQAHSRELEMQVADRTLQLSTMNRLLENEIKERERVEGELAQRAAETAVEAERSRLARELHDAVTQTLFSASLIAEALPVSWDGDPEEGRELLEELRQLNRGALAEMRTLLLELRPAALVEADLDDLIRQLAEAAIGREGMPIDVLVEGDGQLPSDVHIALYRIAQEALNNVLKHARATHVTVELKYEPATNGKSSGGETQRVSLCIQDDGRGFDARESTADHMGLKIMQERAQAIGADIDISSQKDAGTKVFVRWQGTLREEEQANDGG
jgi:signal transduction histidine kinase